MNTIRIISSDKSLAVTAGRLLEKDYVVSSKKIPENFSYFQFNNPVIEEEDINGIALLVIDFSSLQPSKAPAGRSDFIAGMPVANDKYIREHDRAFLKELQRFQIPKLLIINSFQKEILLDSPERHEDVIFSSQIEEELLFRVDLILKKFSSPDNKNAIIIGEMVINLEKYELTVRDMVIELTFKEFEMIKYLISNENKVFSRNTLLSRIWGYDFYGGNRTVDVHMRRIRSKLASPYDQMFKTVRNVGYMFSQKI
jgi:DNA-binding winged helix-turn-helix (wHTH) protein